MIHNYTKHYQTREARLFKRSRCCTCSTCDKRCLSSVKSWRVQLSEAQHFGLEAGHGLATGVACHHIVRWNIVCRFIPRASRCKLVISGRTWAPLTGVTMFSEGSKKRCMKDHESICNMKILKFAGDWRTNPPSFSHLCLYDLHWFGNVLPCLADEPALLTNQLSGSTVSNNKSRPRWSSWSSSIIWLPHNWQANSLLGPLSMCSTPQSTRASAARALPGLNFIMLCSPSPVDRDSLRKWTNTPCMCCMVLQHAFGLYIRRIQTPNETNDNGGMHLDCMALACTLHRAAWSCLWQAPKH